MSDIIKSAKFTRTDSEVTVEVTSFGVFLDQDRDTINISPEDFPAFVEFLTDLAASMNEKP